MPGRPRVLLVDDHPGILKALGRVLSVECDVVGVIADGRDVAEAAMRLQPQVIVVDLNLPHVSGLDVCRQVTRNDPRVKVIIMSAMTDDLIRDEALAAGASGFVDKSAPRRAGPRGEAGIGERVNGFYQVLTRFYEVLPGSTRLCQVLRVLRVRAIPVESCGTRRTVANHEEPCRTQ